MKLPIQVKVGISLVFKALIGSGVHPDLHMVVCSHPLQDSSTECLQLRFSSGMFLVFFSLLFWLTVLSPTAGETSLQVTASNTLE